MNGPYEYGYWMTAVVMSLIFVVFAFSFTRPKDWRDWRSFGAFAAFVVALFTEMYGFPLTIYLLSGWLGSRFPELNLYAHDAGHLWQTIFGISSEDPMAAHFNMLHVLSNVLIAGGLLLIMHAWRVLYKATIPLARTQLPSSPGRKRRTAPRRSSRTERSLASSRACRFG